MKNTLSTKEIIHCATFTIPKGVKTAVSIPSAFGGDILIRNEIITSEEHKTENVLK